jgi:hypothetical protein
MLSHRDAIYAKYGAPPKTEEEREWRRRQRERPQPKPEAPRHQLDTAPPTWAQIDQRIEQRVAAEHECMIGILAELVALLQSDAEMKGPPGPAGPRGEHGLPGLPCHTVLAATNKCLSQNNKSPDHGRRYDEGFGPKG